MEDAMTETTTESETPQILSVTDKQATVQSANGRIIVVSRLGALDYYRLTKALGASANNPAPLIWPCWRPASSRSTNTFSREP